MVSLYLAMNEGNIFFITHILLKLFFTSLEDVLEDGEPFCLIYHMFTLYVRHSYICTIGSVVWAGGLVLLK